MNNKGIYLNKSVQNDNVFVKSSNVELSALVNMPVRKGLERAIVSEGEIVNIVSKSYGHLPNEKFFAEVEAKFIDVGIDYTTRSVNRDNRSFAVDYILNDDSYHIKVKNGNDIIKPMLRFVNSYDGSCKTSGHFGFFRQVCSNGLHVATAKVGFSVKHKGEIVQIVLPEISALVATFMDNEFYSLHKKFEVLAERPIDNLEEFVKMTAEEFNLFQFESSEKNPAPSLNARMVLDVINRESSLFRERPTLWHGYNAFNEVLHGKLKKTFEAQKVLDGKVFEFISSLA